MDDRKRMQAQEQEALLSLCAIVSLTDDLNDLERRIKTIKQGKANLGMLRYTSEKLLADVLATAPNEQLLSLKRNLGSLRIKIGITNIPGCKGENYGRWVSDEAIKELIPIVGNHCMMCGKDYGEQCKCPLRKALNEFPLDIPEETKGCPYFALWSI